MLSNKLAKQLRMGSEVIMEFLRKLCEGAQQKRIRGRLRVWATGLAKARKHTRAYEERRTQVMRSSFSSAEDTSTKFLVGGFKRPTQQ
jgi:hypothetical protein